MTEKIDDMKCYVCGSADVSRHGEYDAQCNLCLVVGALPQFETTESIETPIGGGRKLVQHMPPPEVMDAAKKVSDYFDKRGNVSWALGKIQSRGEDTLDLTVTLDTVRKYAAGFQHVVVPAKSVDRLVSYIQEQERELRILRKGGAKDMVAEIVYQLRLILEEMGAK